MSRARYGSRMATKVTLGDMGHDPAEVARGLVTWQRGDPDEAVAQTLVASSREMNNAQYVLWAWQGRTAQGEPAWVLPVTAAQTAAFAPKGPAAGLARSVAALLDGDVGADPDQLRIEEWNGFTCVVTPGLADPVLGSVAIEDAGTGRGRTRVASFPDGYALGGAPIPLVADPLLRGGGLVALARELVLHPVLVLLALARHGFDPTAIPDDPSGLAESLQGMGVAAEVPLAEHPAGPSFAIDDDACPRRRHARRVMRRLLQKGKIGGHHTEIGHFTRGLPDHEKSDAKEVVEALLRAGLLVEKPSVGQRHISLNRESLPEIHALIERGETADPQLAGSWTAPAPADSP